jgi:hypothetical protein
MMTAHEKLMEELKAINLAPSSPKNGVSSSSDMPASSQQPIVLM